MMIRSIDDDVWNLRLKRINVVTEVDPFRVLEIVKSQLFDLIFMDIQMPHLSGFMLVKKIRESGVDRLKSAPIIALSARSDLSSADFRQSGFTDFLNKPFTSAQLFSVIDRYLNGESASRNMKGEKPAGIEMLFKEVKDDPESLLLILRTFVVDTGNSLEQLKSSIRNNDQDSVAHIAHKILPLFMIIGDELLSERLRRLERKETGRRRGEVASDRTHRQLLDEARRWSEKWRTVSDAAKLTCWKIQALPASGERVVFKYHRCLHGRLAEAVRFCRKPESSLSEIGFQHLEEFLAGLYDTGIKAVLWPVSCRVSNHFQF